jgi:hypothetical protein
MPLARRIAPLFVLIIGLAVEAAEAATFEDGIRARSNTRMRRPTGRSQSVPHAGFRADAAALPDVPRLRLLIQPKEFQVQNRGEGHPRSIGGNRRADERSRCRLSTS